MSRKKLGVSELGVALTPGRYTHLGVALLTPEMRSMLLRAESTFASTAIAMRQDDAMKSKVANVACNTAATCLSDM